MNPSTRINQSILINKSFIRNLESVFNFSRKMVGGDLRAWVQVKFLRKVVSRTHGLQKSPNLKSD
jgi:hypothetical protein